MNKCDCAKKICMSKEEAVDEHSHLTKVLRTGKGVKQELKKQSKELNKYKQK